MQTKEQRQLRAIERLGASLQRTLLIPASTQKNLDDFLKSDNPTLQQAAQKVLQEFESRLLKSRLAEKFNKEFLCPTSDSRTSSGQR